MIGPKEPIDKISLTMSQRSLGRMVCCANRKNRFDDLVNTSKKSNLLKELDIFEIKQLTEMLTRSFFIHNKENILGFLRPCENGAPL